MPAFRPEELALVSRQIAEALAVAQPNERVTFYLSQPQTSAKRIITTGGLYVHGTELHFILGNWQVVYGIPAYGMIYDWRYPMRPTAAKGFHLYLLSSRGDHRTTAQSLGYIVGQHHDELVIDLTKIVSDPLASLSGTAETLGVKT